MRSPTTLADSIVCRCLQITESQIQDAVAFYGCAAVHEVTRVNEAGAGCTVCHCRIRQIIAEARRQALSE